jgi:hypothetical protein
MLNLLICALVAALGGVAFSATKENQLVKEYGRAAMVAGFVVGLAVAVFGPRLH